MQAVPPQHRTFTSYHHRNDQEYKNELVRLGEYYNIFTDWSVDTGDISDSLPSETIRRVIRDDYLRSSTVTILLVGTETRHRKHVDWELKSSMINGSVNKRSGILVINLPAVDTGTVTAAHGEQAVIYPHITNWNAAGHVPTRAEYERLYPYMPDRIVDNLIAPNAKISVTNWHTISLNPGKLDYLIRITAANRSNCQYDLSRPMRRADRNSLTMAGTSVWK